MGMEKWDWIDRNEILGIKEMGMKIHSKKRILKMRMENWNGKTRMKKREWNI